MQQNNAVRELELQEEREIRRILAELSEAVAEEAVYLRRNTQVLSDLDFTFAKAKYAYALDATLPVMSEFTSSKPLHRHPPQGAQEGREADASEVAHPGSVIDLHRARHPLLDQKTVVPIDVYLDDDTYIIVITGPNTGGKTVTLKTVGLLALMAQSGLLIPVDQGSRFSIFDGIYADIGDEQSIEQSLSTFSGHMTNIISILEEVDPHCLVLLDELGAGTDPEEGSALAMALLENLRDRGITTLATTHYSDLKLYAHNTPGVRNASMEFDVESLSPTYELSIGLPGRSQALTIARRLGLNPVIVEKAESIVRPDTLQADALLEDIKRAKMEALTAAERARERERQAKLAETDLRSQLAKIEEARRAVIAETRELMQVELDEARKELDQLRRQARTSFASSSHGQSGQGVAHDDFLARADKELARRKQAAEEVNRRVEVPGANGEGLIGPIEIGDRVWVASLQASGEVLAVYPRAVRPTSSWATSGSSCRSSGSSCGRRPSRMSHPRARMWLAAPTAGLRWAQAPVWSLICAANASRPASTSLNAISTMPIWLASPGRASSMATAPAPCAPRCAMSCAAIPWSLRCAPARPMKAATALP